MHSLCFLEDRCESFRPCPPYYLRKESQISKYCYKIKILCPVECKSGSRCNDDQDCPKGQCTTTFPFDDVRECVCDKDCKQGSTCDPELQYGALCDGNGRCKEIAKWQWQCQCGEGNN